MTVGQRRNAEIEAWQQASGLKPSEHQSLLGEMSVTAFELIRIIELERSGIRDGDGYWSGSDPMGGTARALAGLIQEYESRMITRAQERKDGNAGPWADYGELAPF